MISSQSFFFDLPHVAEPPQSIVMQRESIELVRVFIAIPDTEPRRRINAMVNALAAPRHGADGNGALRSGMLGLLQNYVGPRATSRA